VHEEGLEEMWQWRERLPELQWFIALADGEVVGAAQMLAGRTAVFLMGGAVREESRGRGAYRALVRARWDAAVERGTPALTVGAGSMSAPVLEGLGFETVGWSDVLEDSL
jgi:GNAT superfamily N-acetyltransferase